MSTTSTRTPRLRLCATTLSLAVCLVACGETHRATLGSGDGLRPESPVLANGVLIGEVDSLRLAGDVVQVEFSVDRGQELFLHADACVEVGRLDGAPALIVAPGENAEWESGAHLLPCAPTPIAPHGAAPSTAPPASPEVAAPAVTRRAVTTSSESPCDQLDVSITSLGRLSPQSFMPSGGVRFEFEFTNRGDRSVELPPSPTVVIYDGSRGTLQRSEIPSTGDWFMPIVVPANGSATGRLTFVADAGADVTVGGFEIDDITVRGAPFDACRLTGSLRE